MTNPFDIPEAPPGFNQPLCPWRTPEHAGLYADVDSSLAQLDRFATAIEDWDLRRQGKLVLVTGESGCGKTSVVNHCADVLDRRMNGRPDPGRPPELVIDLARHRYSRRMNDDQVARVREVCEQVIIKLGDVLAFPPNFPTDAKAWRIVYPQLSKVLGRYSRILVVLLPSTDAAKDLDEYAYLAGECARIVFFSESSERDEVDASLDALNETERRGIVRLRVQAVEPSLAGQHAMQLIRHRVDDPEAWVNPEDVMEAFGYLAGGSPTMSVGRMNVIFRRLWDDWQGRRSEGPVPKADIYKSMLGEPSGGFEKRGTASQEEGP
ncbi:ATP-binding protein [Micromonospora sp. WMMD1102]|uniref:ATP-binding protein n=1 Tax=Micromonospora sp. WMMD1102 TaxID=3016105 RepID=UPI002415511B|nr:ATP-binding protein [Micromonospora sp. WMMD1102]MDG4785162.1 ATP-binding protein [Micromonospora sp. WMMD1102]